MTRFVKLDENDKPLSASSKKWVAVLDKQLGLIWDKDDLGKMTQEQAETIAASAKDNRRLPTVEELFLLADRTKRDPAIDTQFFPSCKSDWYRTSSPFVGASGLSWIVGFYDGGSSDMHHDDAPFVRLVRSAPAGAGQ